MALGEVIARLAVSLSLETAAFERGATLAEKRMEQSRKRFEAIGKKMTGIGRTMSLALTVPIVAFGVAAVKAAQESAEALGQVDAALKSMGDGAGRTREQLQALATNQMRQSLFDDDEILRKVTANLLTFGSVAGEQFDRAQQAAIDLAARMGTDLQAATIMIGKALNDPAKGLASLRRVGIQFTEQQQDQIKAMAAVGDTAGAQTIMLAELERQFGGSAAAMRAANPMAALKQSFEEFKETVGEKILPLLPRIAGAMTKVIDAFGKMTPAMQEAVIIGAALAAALGPVLMVLGGLIQISAPLLAFVKTLGILALAQTTVGGAAGVAAAGFGSLAASLAAVLLPVAAVAAAGYLIYQNWDKIAPVLDALWETIQSSIGPPLMRLIEALKPALTELWQGPFGTMIRAVSPYLLEFGRIVAQVLGSKLIQSIQGAAMVIGLALDAIAVGIRIVTALFDGSLGRVAVEAVMRLYNGVKTWLFDKLNAVWEGVKSKIDAVKGWFHGLYMAVVGGSIIPDMIDGIAAQMARLEAVMVVPAKKSAAAVAQAMREMAAETHALFDRLFPEIGRASAFLAEGKAIKALGLSPDAEREAMARSSSLFSSGSPYGTRPFSPDFGNASLVGEGLSNGIDALARRLEILADKAGVTTVRIAKSFKDMANDTLSSLSRLTSAIKGGGFLGILEAVIGLGLQLGSIGAFGKGISKRINAVPGYAGGTNFHPGGLALVGERGPELVSMPRGSRVAPNNALGGGVLDIRPSPLFEVFLDGKLIQAAPALVQAGGNAGVAQMGYRRSRSLG